MVRYFEYKDEKTNKFWEINVLGKKVTIRYGKVGTPGQTIFKEHATLGEATEHAEKVILEKTRKGYTEGGDANIIATASKSVSNLKPSVKNSDVTVAAALDTTPVQFKELVKKSVELARLVAANTAAPEDLLTELARHTDEGVRRRIAANPSSPAKAAMDAGSQFPEQLLENPSFDLYILAEPNLLQGIGASALRSLLKREVCPESFFSYAASQDDEATQLAVLTNSKAPIIVVQSLLESNYPRVKEAARKHSVLNGQISEVEASWQNEFTAGLLEEEKNRDKVPEAHKSLAYLILSQAEDFSNLSEAERWVIRTAWTKEERQESFWMPKFNLDHENCPISILEIAAKDSNTDLRIEVAGNLKLPKHLQECLVEDAEIGVLQALASNENIDTNIMAKLAKNTDLDILKTIAGNAKITPDVIKILINNADPVILVTLSKNYSLSREVFLDLTEKLAKNKEEDIRKTVCEWDWKRGSKIFEDIKFPIFNDKFFEILASDQSPLVRIEISKYSELPENLVALLSKDSNPQVRDGIARNIKASKNILDELAKDKAIAVRRNIASNPNASLEAIETLSKDKDKQIKIAILKNPSAPEKVKDGIYEMFLKELKHDDLYELSKSSNLSLGILENLSKNKDESIRENIANYQDSVDVLMQLAKDKSSDVRRAVASNEKASIGILELLSKDKDENVRANIASNLNCTVDILEKLSNDKETYVLQSVIANLNTPIELIKKFASHKDEGVRASVAQYSRGNIEILKGLAGDSESYVRRMVANPQNVDDEASMKVPLEILEKLAVDEEADVRTAVAENPYTSAELLRLLSKDKNLDRYSNSKAISAVANNPNTPQDALEYLSDIYINWLYKNEIPESVQPADLRKFMEDGYDFESGLQDRVESNKKSKDLSGLRNEFISRMVAGSKPSVSRCVAFLLPDCPPASLAKYQRSSWWIERCAIAQNPNIPDTVLKQLLKDPNSSVQSCVQMTSQKKPDTKESVVIKDTTKEKIVVSNDANWDVSFQKALLEEDESLVGSVDDSVYRSFTNLAYMFWSKIRKGQELSDAEMLFVKRSSKAHRSTVALNPGAPIEIVEDLIENSNSTAEVLAADESTSESILEKILNKPSFDRKYYIAQNPKASLKVLEKIADDILKSTDEDFLGQMAASAIANNPNCSTELLTKLAHLNDLDIDTKQAIASNSKASPDLLMLLADDESDYVRLDVASNESTPSEVLGKMALDDENSIRLRVAENLSTSKEILEQLSKDDEESVREYVAANINTPKSILENLAKDDKSDVLQAVAANPNAPKAVLENLLSLKDNKVNSALVRNPNIDSDLLGSILEAGDEDILRDILQHPNLSIALFESFVSSLEGWGLYNLGSNDNLSADKLTLLSKHKNENGPMGVARNLNLNPGLMSRLAESKNEQVRTELAQNSGLTLDLIKLLSTDKVKQVQSSIAENPLTPPEILMSLSKEKDKDLDIKSALARNPNTPPTILVELMNFDELKGDIARNPSTPQNVLKELAIDDDPRIREFVAGNQNTPADVLKDLLFEPYVDKSVDMEKILAAFLSSDALAELRAELLKKLCAGLKPSYERVYGLLLADCPAAVLTKCAKSAFWLERCAVAQNSQTPVKLLQALQNDTNPVVCGAAQR